MGIKNGSITYQIYHTVGGKLAQKDFDPRRFVPIGTTARESIGWVNPGQPHRDDQELVELFDDFGSSTLMVVRRDEIKLPKAVIRKETDARVVAMADEDGISVTEVSKAVRKAYEQDVVRDLLERIPPTTKLVEMLWNGSDELVVLGTGKLAEAAVVLFERTTGATADRAGYPRQSLTAPGADLRQHAALAQLQPGSFFGAAPVVALDAAPPEEIGYLAEKDFIGQEFLTFLLFDVGRNPSLDTAQLGIVDPNLTEVLLAHGPRLQIAGDSGAKGPFRMALNGSQIEDRTEADVAILDGALVTHLALEVGVGSRVYKFMLGADGSVRGLKLPDLFTEPEETAGEEKKKLPVDAVVELRITALAEIRDLITRLYGRFLRLRLSSDWRSWSASLRDDCREAAARAA